MESIELQRGSFTLTGYFAQWYFSPFCDGMAADLYRPFWTRTVQSTTDEAEGSILVVFRRTGMSAVPPRRCCLRVTELLLTCVKAIYLSSGRVAMSRMKASWVIRS